MAATWVWVRWWRKCAQGARAVRAGAPRRDELGWEPMRVMPSPRGPATCAPRQRGKKGIGAPQREPLAEHPPCVRTHKQSLFVLGTRNVRRGVESPRHQDCGPRASTQARAAQFSRHRREGRLACGDGRRFAHIDLRAGPAQKVEDDVGAEGADSASTTSHSSNSMVNPNAAGQVLLFSLATLCTRAAGGGGWCPKKRVSNGPPRSAPARDPASTSAGRPSRAAAHSYATPRSAPQGQQHRVGSATCARTLWRHRRPAATQSHAAKAPYGECGDNGATPRRLPRHGAGKRPRHNKQNGPHME